MRALLGILSTLALLGCLAGPEAAVAPPVGEVDVERGDSRAIQFAWTMPAGGGWAVGKVPLDGELPRYQIAAASTEEAADLLAVCWGGLVADEPDRWAGEISMFSTSGSDPFTADRNIGLDAVPREIGFLCLASQAMTFQFKYSFSRGAGTLEATPLVGGLARFAEAPPAGLNASAPPGEMAASRFEHSTQGLEAFLDVVEYLGPSVWRSRGVVTFADGTSEDFDREGFATGAGMPPGSSGFVTGVARTNACVPGGTAAVETTTVATTAKRRPFYFHVEGDPLRLLGFTSECAPPATTE